MMNRWEEFQVRVFKIPRKTRLLKGDLDITPLIDCVFLLLIFFMLTSSFVKPAGIKVSLPKTVTADVLQEEKFVVVVSADDIIYLEEKAVSLDDLRERLKQAKVDSILIKADKRASLGRVIEIWDLCREIGIERVNIATVQMRKE